jgi:hypothetical protein
MNASQIADNFTIVMSHEVKRKLLKEVVYKHIEVMMDLKDTYYWKKEGWECSEEDSLKCNKCKTDLSHMGYEGGKINTCFGCSNLTNQQQKRADAFNKQFNVIVKGIVCNECKETLPPHTMNQHLDLVFMKTFHIC